MRDFHAFELHEYSKGVTIKLLNYFSGRVHPAVNLDVRPVFLCCAVDPAQGLGVDLLSVVLKWMCAVCRFGFVSCCMHSVGRLV
jgi:hypothetical protein